jgi:hypothetical protein
MIVPSPSEYEFTPLIPEKEFPLTERNPSWILNEPFPKLQFLSDGVSNQSAFVTVTSVRYKLMGLSKLIVGVGVYVGVGVLVAVGVFVFVGVMVGVNVWVGDGVMVGPNNCPGPHADITVLKTTINIPTIDKCFMLSSWKRIPFRINY